MKKLLPFLLALAILATLCACRLNKQEAADTVDFYYLRQNIVYGADDGVIAPEARQAGEYDLNTLLSHYLAGPQTEDLYSPFPAGTKLLMLNRSENSLTVILSEEFGVLEGMDHILACACVAQTCFGLTDAEEIAIRIAETERSITMTRESLTLSDDSDTIDATIGTEPAGS